MRRAYSISRQTLAPRVSSIDLSRQLLGSTSRHLTSTSIYNQPRTSVRPARSLNINAEPSSLNPVPPSRYPINRQLHEDASPSTPESPSSEADPSASPTSPSPAPLSSYASSFIPPSTPDTPLPLELAQLHTYMQTTFGPSNQPLPSLSMGTAMTVVSLDGPPGATKVVRVPSEDAPEESALALVTPFEGGEFYITQAVERIASEMDAEIVRINLPLAVGFGGRSSPLEDVSAPPLPSHLNPLLLDGASSNGLRPSSEAREEDDEDGEEHEMQARVVRIPLFESSETTTTSVLAPRVDEAWVHFFSHLISVHEPTSTKKRIILVESACGMAETFDTWWPSLTEAVRRRRCWTRSSRKTGGRSKGTSLSLTQPTSIVISCPPSLLRPHTAMSLGSPVTSSEPSRTAAQVLAAEVGLEDEEHAALADDHSPLWWGSVESDRRGRTTRNRRRLQTLLKDPHGKLLPAFGPLLAGQPPRPSMGHPVLEAIAAAAHANKASRGSQVHGNTVTWHTLPVVPETRNMKREKESRERFRRVVNAALVTRAISQLNGRLIDTLAVLPEKSTSEAKSDGFWDEDVKSWSDSRHLANLVVGEALAGAKGLQSITWHDVLRARGADTQYLRRLDNKIQTYLPDAPTSSETSATPEAPVRDFVVEEIKASKSLNKYEKRLLPCIVDPTKLASTSFNDVHLPRKTIDGIRTMVSLPLLHPEAFQGGVLKNHSTSGALLFGPPGTGKTLLARAVARESGARMLAVQPSDVTDMFVGEGEKLVKAVFSLARRLSPCVIFLDEIDSIAGARSSGNPSGSGKAHNQILTEFMQEMDGLSSAIANKEKRIVVVGATNRPFDLDDAILRRLPRRLLIDLPGVDDRKDLCVGAALAAVKDIVKLPWSKETENPDSESSAGPTPPPSGGHKQAELLVLAPEVDRRRRKVPLARASSCTAEMESLQVVSMSVASATEPADSTTADLFDEEEYSQTELAHTAGAVPTENNTGDQPAAQRVLTARHFKQALEEIRPSSSEEGTLPELRKWAEQYGEGGQRRGKKRGFGKGFGFGDLQGKKESGYGKVVQDE
ncbi:hypothetical protein P7C73_g390, partial [Tremellales sp. Uapishka_1]